MSRSHLLFFVVLALVVAERVVELVVCYRHRRRLFARGAVEHGRALYPWMVVVHTGLLVAAPLEVVVLTRPFVPWLGGTMIGVVMLTMGLRYWAIATLGERWTTRVLVLPGAPPVTKGPYRLTRHPNYLAVVLEVAALPLIHTAWLTALLASFANALVLRQRIRTEEAALAAASDYDSHFADRPRFVPVDLGR